MLCVCVCVCARGATYPPPQTEFHRHVQSQCDDISQYLPEFPTEKLKSIKLSQFSSHGIIVVVSRKGTIKFNKAPANRSVMSARSKVASKDSWQTNHEGNPPCCYMEEDDHLLGCSVLAEYDGDKQVYRKMDCPQEGTDREGSGYEALCHTEILVVARVLVLCCVWETQVDNRTKQITESCEKISNSQKD